MQLERVTDLSDPRLDVYRNLKPRNAERDQRLFVAEGPTVVERVLSSGLQVCSLLISDRKYASFETRLPHDIPVYRVTDEQARELIGFDFHAGVMVCARRPGTPRISDFLPVTGACVVVAGERITDPENVGALIRIGAAFGTCAVLLGPGSADPFSRRVLRVSMGNVLFLPILETPDLPETLRHLSGQHSCQVVATVLDPEAPALHHSSLPNRCVLVFGNEYDGLSRAVLDATTEKRTIPMLNGTDSLNIAVSAGICLYEFRRAWPVAP